MPSHLQQCILLLLFLFGMQFWNGVTLQNVTPIKVCSSCGMEGKRHAIVQQLLDNIQGGVSTHWCYRVANDATEQLSTVGCSSSGLVCPPYPWSISTCAITNSSNCCTASQLGAPSPATSHACALLSDRACVYLLIQAFFQVLYLYSWGFPLIKFFRYSWEFALIQFFRDYCLFVTKFNPMACVSIFALDCDS